MIGLMKQLNRITHRATKPACAPKVVVAISSPEPTIDAQRIMPGPMRRRIARKVDGGVSTSSGWIA